MNFYEIICGQTELGYKRLSEKFENTEYFNAIQTILGTTANKGLSRATIIFMDKIPPTTSSNNIISICPNNNVPDYVGWDFEAVIKEIITYLHGQGFRIYKNPVGNGRIDLQISWRSPYSKKENNKPDAI